MVVGRPRLCASQRCVTRSLTSWIGILLRPRGAACVPLSHAVGEGQGEGPSSLSALSVVRHRPHPYPLPFHGRGGHEFRWAWGASLGFARPFDERSYHPSNGR